MTESAIEVMSCVLSNIAADAMSNVRVCWSKYVQYLIVVVLLL